jgi:hypothetical protein
MPHIEKKNALIKKCLPYIESLKNHKDIRIATTENLPLLENFFKEIEKDSKKLPCPINKFDAMSIVFGNIPKDIKNVDSHKLAEKIVDYITVTIPQKYELLLPLPSITLPTGELFINNNLSLTTSNDEQTNNTARGLLSLLAHEKAITTMKIKHNGYIGGLYSEDWTNVYINIKKIILLGILLGVFKINSSNIPTFSTAENSPLKYPQQKGVLLQELQIIDLEESHEPHEKFSLELPYDLSILLYQLELCYSCSTHPDLIKKIKSLGERLDIINKQNESVLKHKKKELILKHIAKLEAAISWAFDSLLIMEQNETVAYIQIILGLEALFSKPEDQHITEMLASRCAYLISDNYSQREDYYNDIRKIYTIRSKIIHGVQSKLNAEEIKYLYKAESFLNNAISKEIQLLINSYNKR